MRSASRERDQSASVRASPLGPNDRMKEQERWSERARAEGVCGAVYFCFIDFTVSRSFSHASRSLFLSQPLLPHVLPSSCAILAATEREGKRERERMKDECVSPFTRAFLLSIRGSGVLLPLSLPPRDVRVRVIH